MEDPLVLLKQKIIKTDAVLKLLSDKKKENNLLMCKLQALNTKYIAKEQENKTLDNMLKEYRIQLQNNILQLAKLPELKVEYDKLTEKYNTDMSNLQLKYQSVNLELEKCKAKGTMHESENKVRNTSKKDNSGRQAKRILQLQNQIKHLQNEIKGNPATCNCQVEIMKYNEKIGHLKDIINKCKENEYESDKKMESLLEENKELRSKILELQLENNMLLEKDASDGEPVGNSLDIIEKTIDNRSESKTTALSLSHIDQLPTLFDYMDSDDDDSIPTTLDTTQPEKVIETDNKKNKIQIKEIIAFKSNVENSRDFVDRKEIEEITKVQESKIDVLYKKVEELQKREEEFMRVIENFTKNKENELVKSKITENTIEDDNMSVCSEFVRNILKTNANVIGEKIQEFNSESEESDTITKIMTDMKSLPSLLSPIKEWNRLDRVKEHNVKLNKSTRSKVTSKRIIKKRRKFRKRLFNRSGNNSSSEYETKMANVLTRRKIGNVHISFSTDYISDSESCLPLSSNESNFDATEEDQIKPMYVTSIPTKIYNNVIKSEDSGCIISDSGDSIDHVKFYTSKLNDEDEIKENDRESVNEVNAISNNYEKQLQSNNLNTVTRRILSYIKNTGQVTVIKVDNISNVFSNNNLSKITNNHAVEKRTIANDVDVNVKRRRIDVSKDVNCTEDILESAKNDEVNGLFTHNESNEIECDNNRKQIETINNETNDLERSSEPIDEELRTESLGPTIPHSNEIDIKLDSETIGEELSTEPREHRNEPISTKLHSETIALELHNERINRNVCSEPIASELHSGPIASEFHNEPISPKLCTEPIGLRLLTAPQELHSVPIGLELSSESIDQELHSEPIASERHSELISRKLCSEPIGVKPRTEPQELHSKPIGLEPSRESIASELHSELISRKLCSEPIGVKPRTEPQELHSKPIGLEPSRESIASELHIEPIGVIPPSARIGLKSRTELHSEAIGLEPPREPIASELHSEPIALELHNEPITTTLCTEPIGLKPRTEPQELHSESIRLEPSRESIASEPSREPIASELHSEPIGVIPPSESIASDLHNETITTKLCSEPIGLKPRTEPEELRSESIVPELRSEPIASEPHSEPISLKPLTEALQLHSESIRLEPSRESIASELHSTPIVPETFREPIYSELHSEPIGVIPPSESIASELHNERITTKLCSKPIGLKPRTEPQELRSESIVPEPRSEPIASEPHSEPIDVIPPSEPISLKPLTEALQLHSEPIGLEPPRKPIASELHNKRITTKLCSEPIGLKPLTEPLQLHSEPIGLQFSIKPVQLLTEPIGPEFNTKQIIPTEPSSEPDVLEPNIESYRHEPSSISCTNIKNKRLRSNVLNGVKTLSYEKPDRTANEEIKYNVKDLFGSDSDTNVESDGETKHRAIETNKETIVADNVKTTKKNKTIAKIRNALRRSNRSIYNCHINLLSKKCAEPTIAKRINEQYKPPSRISVKESACAKRKRKEEHSESNDIADTTKTKKQFKRPVCFARRSKKENDNVEAINVTSVEEEGVILPDAVIITTPELSNVLDSTNFVTENDASAPKVVATIDDPIIINSGSSIEPNLIATVDSQENNTITRSSLKRKYCKPLGQSAAFSFIKQLLNWPSDENVVETVLQKFVNQRPHHIAKIILEVVASNVNEKPDTKYTPTAPVMTRTQRVLQGFMNRLDRCGVDIFDTFLKLTEHYLLHDVTLEQIDPITRLYVAICKQLKLIKRIRLFCCDAVYFMDTYVTFLYVVLSNWFEVIPMECDSVEIPLVKVVVHCILAKPVQSTDVYLNNLKVLLNVYHGYPKEKYNENEVFLQLLNKFKDVSTDLNEFAILLLCKRSDPTSIQRHVINQVIPLINDDQISYVCKEALTRLTLRIISQFDGIKHANILQSINESLRKSSI